MDTLTHTHICHRVRARSNLLAKCWRVGGPRGGKNVDAISADYQGVNNSYNQGWALARFFADLRNLELGKQVSSPQIIIRVRKSLPFHLQIKSVKVR